MNYAQLFAEYEKQLTELGEEAESLAFTYREVKQLPLTDFYLSLREEVSPEDEVLLASLFQKLAQHIPAQYIIGKTVFHGLPFQVDSRVLIPRPETEELVDLILEENSEQNLTVLDIGTGSGAIAVSLKKARPNWQITATDISLDALAVARENALQNKTDIRFVQSDIYSDLSEKFDLIISNPPYIAYEDKDEVGINVWSSEPHLALFADEAGLAIYRNIIEAAPSYLKETGKLYFEIGYKQGEALQQLLGDVFPEKRVRVLSDIAGKERKVVADNG